MEVYSLTNFYVFWNEQTSLWCDKNTGLFEIRDNINPPEGADLKCLGITHGIVGKLMPFEGVKYASLIVIADESLIGAIGKDILHQVDKVALLPLNQEDFKSCDNEETDPLDSIPGLLVPEIADCDDSKFALRIYQDIMRLFNESHAFYYSKSLDLTNSAQRLEQHKVLLSKSITESIKPYDIANLNYDWKQCDERFFWNLNIISDIINIKNASNKMLSQWILPIILGYIHIDYIDYKNFNPEGLLETSNNKKHSAGATITPLDKVVHNLKLQKNLKLTDENILSLENSSQSKSATTNLESGQKLTYCLISRRNRHRTGTRYNRRGLDDKGHAANYVETEQLIAVANHILSFTMVRGSIPLYWTQGGMKYRPPPMLEKDSSENFAAFKRHFDREIKQYNEVVVVNLAEQNGREKFISEAYLEQVLRYDSSHLTYVTFDFHEYCQGMKFENISVLTESVADIIKHMQFCWFDTKGFISKQNSVFRINCIDCLDRTNMVQMAFAKIILEIQLRKIGLLAPETNFPPSLTRIFQFSWANNGDALSVQYAGTAALKSDFTRTGQKKLTSLLKDGYNSATRYYMNQFRDAYRQIAYQTLQNTCPLSLDAATEEDKALGLDGTKSTGTRPTSASLTNTYGNIRKLFSSSEMPVFRKLLKPILLGKGVPFDEGEEEEANSNNLPEYENDDALEVKEHYDLDKPLSDVLSGKTEDILTFISPETLLEFVLQSIVPEIELIYGSWFIKTLCYLNTQSLSRIEDISKLKSDLNTKCIHLLLTILIISSKAYYLISYDHHDNLYRIVHLQRVSLQKNIAVHLEKYEFVLPENGIKLNNAVNITPAILYLNHCSTSSTTYLSNDSHPEDGSKKSSHTSSIQNAKSNNGITTNLLTLPATENPQSLQSIYDCFKAVLCDLMHLRVDFREERIIITEGNNLLSHKPFTLDIQRTHTQLKDLGYTAKDIQFFRNKVQRRHRKPSFKQQNIISPLSQKLAEDISLNVIHNLHPTDEEINQKNILIIPRQCSEPDLLVTSDKIRAKGGKRSHSNLDGTTSTNLPSDWESVLNPGVDHANLKMKCENSALKNIEPLVDQPVPLQINKEPSKNSASCTYKGSDQDENRKKYDIMKAKLRSKTRILEL